MTRRPDADSLYLRLGEQAPEAGAPGRTDTTRTIETSDENVSPIEPIVQQ